MSECVLCHRRADEISGALGLCAACILADTPAARARAAAAHARSRERFGLPPRPPRSAGGVRCRRCVNACRLEAGQVSYCGVWANRGGRLVGGDPSCQVAHALAAARAARSRRRGRILRICWETNGSVSREGLKQMAELSLRSGGCIKFDLKAWDDPLHRALCGASNRRTLANFRRLAGSIGRRPDPPLLIASTLLVPGYVDASQVARIAAFIAALDPGIPYALLAFHPSLEMSDLPTTSRGQATDCLAAAEDAGLTRVRIGNAHLLA